MEHNQLVNDYHKVLRMIKNYSLSEIDSLVKAIGSYTEMVRAGDGLQPTPKGVPVNLAEGATPNGECEIDSAPVDRETTEPQIAVN